MAVEIPAAPQHEWLDHRYYPVDQAQQRQACELLGIWFVHPFQRQDGGLDIISTRDRLAVTVTDSLGPYAALSLG